jgi:methionyl aminopeptidase
MSVNTPDELRALQAAGRVVAATIRAMRRAVRAGVTTAELDGFYADACRTVVVGDGRPQALRLVRTAEQALANALKVATAGRPLNAIGATVQETVQARGFSVCDGLMGHGIGRRIHEAPDVPNHYEAELSQPLGEGLVITVEPLVAAGGPAVRLGRDGWTVRTADASWSAHAEHTVVIRDGAPPLVLTV